MNDEVSLREWMEEYTRSVIGAVLTGLNDQKKTIGEENVKYLALSLVECLVGSVMYQQYRLQKELIGSKKTKENKALDDIGEVKGLMQEAIAGGFEAAMKKFTGQTIEYYCVIRPVPASLSKELN